MLPCVVFCNQCGKVVLIPRKSVKGSWDFLQAFNSRFWRVQSWCVIFLGSDAPFSAHSGFFGSFHVFSLDSFSKLGYNARKVAFFGMFSKTKTEAKKVMQQVKLGQAFVLGRRFALPLTD